MKSIKPKAFKSFNTVAPLTIAGLLLFTSLAVKASEVIPIYNCIDLQNIEAYGQYILANDIDCSGQIFMPLPLSGKPFSGGLEGNNKVISNLVIQKPKEWRVGLFAEISRIAQISDLTLLNANITGGQYVGALAGSSEGAIKDLTLVDVNITGERYVGALAGYSAGTIENVKVTSSNPITAPDNGLTKSTITGRASVGGLMGYNQKGDIIDSSVSARIIRAENYQNDASWFGGLVGFNNEGTIRNSHSDIFIEQDFQAENMLEHVGGITGSNSGLITQSTATGTVMGSHVVGGLVGQHINDGIIEHSIASVDVIATYTEHNTGDLVGGLVGFFNGSIIRNSAAIGGSVKGYSEVGGLVGRAATVTIQDSYTNSTIYLEGMEGPAGGLVGYILGGGGGIINSYAVGAIHMNNPSSSYVGGLIGLNDPRMPEIVTSSYWDIETTGIPNSMGGAGKITAEMKDKTTYVDWDFDKTWEIMTDNYPQLLDIPQSPK